MSQLSWASGYRLDGAMTHSTGDLSHNVGRKKRKKP